MSERSHFRDRKKRKHLPFVAWIYPVGRIGRCPYSWFRATMGSLVYPVIQRVQPDAWIRSRCVWFRLMTEANQPWLHNNARHKWAMIPLVSNTWSENSLLLEPQLHTEIEARICFSVVSDFYQKMSQRVAESHRQGVSGGERKVIFIAHLVYILRIKCSYFQYLLHYGLSSGDSFQLLIISDYAILTANSDHKDPL